MNAKSLSICLTAVAVAALSNGCLVKRTVTVNGGARQEGYAIKRPLKEAIQNSQ